MCPVPGNREDEGQLCPGDWEGFQGTSSICHVEQKWKKIPDGGGGLEEDGAKGPLNSNARFCHPTGMAFGENKMNFLLTLH